MSNLLIWTIAGGRYRVYADIFKACAKRAYPQYSVSVEEYESLPFKKYAAACMRFTQKPFGVHSEPYTYITDVDMMICPEPVSILDFHTAEIKASGLPYSNIPRFHEPNGTNRLTGLHFVTPEWWAKTLKARGKEHDRLMSGEIGDKADDDEQMLMRIVKDGGLAIPETGNLIRRHHGIHLGTIRAIGIEKRGKLRSELGVRIDQSKAEYWLNFVETKDYNLLMSDIKKQDNQAYGEFQVLERYCHQRVKESK